ncbi:hypothetical protein WDU94_000208 [Cyamophila willieti]
MCESKPDHMYKESLKALQKRMQLMFNNKKHADTEFTVKKHKFYALSELVTVASSKLDAIISEHFTYCNDKKIKLYDVKCEKSFLVILQYMYGLDINFSELTMHVLCGVINLAETYKLDEFAKDLKTHLSKIDKFEMDSLAILLNTSRKYNLEELYKKLKVFAYEHAEEFVNSDNVVKLQYECLLDLIKSDWFCAKEIDILKGILKWHTEMNTKENRESIEDNDEDAEIQDITRNDEGESDCESVYSATSCMQTDIDDTKDKYLVESESETNQMCIDDDDTWEQYEGMEHMELAEKVESCQQNPNEDNANSGTVVSTQEDKGSEHNPNEENANIEAGVVSNQEDKSSDHNHNEDNANSGTVFSTQEDKGSEHNPNEDNANIEAVVVSNQEHKSSNHNHNEDNANSGTVFSTQEDKGSEHNPNEDNANIEAVVVSNQEHKSSNHNRNEDNANSGTVFSTPEDKGSEHNPNEDNANIEAVVVSNQEHKSSNHNHNEDNANSGTVFSTQEDKGSERNPNEENANNEAVVVSNQEDKFSKLMKTMETFSENVLKSLLLHIRMKHISLFDFVSLSKTNLFENYKHIFEDNKLFSNTNQVRKKYGTMVKMEIDPDSRGSFFKFRPLVHLVHIKSPLNSVSTRYQYCRDLVHSLSNIQCVFVLEWDANKLSCVKFLLNKSQFYVLVCVYFDMTVGIITARVCSVYMADNLSVLRLEFGIDAEMLIKRVEEIYIEKNKCLDRMVADIKLFKACR